MTNEGKTFRLQHRGWSILSAVTEAFLVLYTLIISIVRFNVFLRGDTADWQNSWWVTAILCILFVFFLKESLQDVFLQLTISKEGIWYHQLGSKRFIPWKQIERVGITRTYLTGRKQYGFILKPESDSEKGSFLRNKQKDLVIPLSIFVHRWLGSDLQNEVKRLKPQLPMQ